MHHGYYPYPEFRNHKAAQLLMIEQALKFGFNLPSSQNLSMGFFDGKRMVDVGCGVGGSSRYIVKSFGGFAMGLSLSPFQIGRANDYSAKAGLADRLSYQVADAMKMPFADNSFDLSKSVN
ncbi:methyltransferase domain-containing protein [archaeon]|nr:MAG: methyltransferase domain-containing protein [archaeon]